MWESTLKRENNYPPSTTSKVVLENENESISPDFRTILSTVNLFHDKNSEWIVSFSELDPHSVIRKESIHFSLWVPANRARKGTSWGREHRMLLFPLSFFAKPSEKVKAYPRTQCSWPSSPAKTITTAHETFPRYVNFHCCFPLCLIV